MIERSLFESLEDSQNIIISGKGGVGKSTISAAVALKFSENEEKTIGIDMDAAHSLSDSFGYSIGVQEGGTFHMKHSQNLDLYFLGQIIPDVFDDENFSELNTYLDALLQGENTFLTLLRLALHPTFAGMPLPHENAAYVLQLLDLMERDLMHKISDSTITSQKVREQHTRRIIDSENTKGLIRVIKAVVSIKRTLENLHKSFYGNALEKMGGTLTREAIKRQGNLYKLSQSDIIKNPDGYTSEALNFHMALTRAKIVIVTQPGYNDLNQTINEVKFLISIGLTPSHIVVNKYKDSFKKDAENTKKIYNMLQKLFDDTIGISIVDSDFEMVNPNMSEVRKQQVATGNLQRIANVI